MRRMERRKFLKLCAAASLATPAIAADARPRPYQRARLVDEQGRPHCRVLLLKGFERVTLQPGESRTVRFTLTPQQLSFWNREMREVNEPGPVAVHVGNSSASLKTAEYRVV